MTVPGAQFGIVSASSGKVLTADGHRVRQSWPAADRRPVQQWRLEPACGGRHTFLVRNTGSGLFLTAAVSAGAAEVVLAPDRGNPLQCWRLVPLHTGRYALENLAYGTCLDLWDARDDDAASVALHSFWGGSQQQWALREATGHRKTRAVLTLVREEPEFLPIWLRYYSRFFPPEDIYVLHHRPSPDLRPANRFVHIPVHQEVFSSDWQRDLVQRHQHELVDRYDTVLCTDVDEIVAPDPHTCDLGTYIDHFGDDYVNCTGYEILHLRDQEPAFDPARKILCQRSAWFANPLYSKPLLARVPMMWRGGFHERADYGTNPDPHLYLIHLHRMDYEICRRRHQRRSNYARAQDDIDNSRGYQNRITDAAEFHHWFYKDRANGDPIYPEPVPEHWRQVA
ncbi:RICIN domain-containing protein [Streptomyces sp. B1866]|uniref:RICIN domain-containing protein n=1 Tax=Streptomyces sp. B1866 TaxID=3075431 RepID=UPI0028927574|nr:RICIN domain-containing protein [Streptomyces sp. B1866]MDT3395131.1 RICIN domain-containing protein [Streptomyces sp. B1866]